MKIDHLARNPSSVWTWCGYNVLRHRPRTQGRIFYSDAEFIMSHRRCPECVERRRICKEVKPL